ncbi:DNA replication and repair protein RecF [Candidatus Babeliales bacterium]|nr:DNA replication and repair protein RecF [Candidatus Babeliales bacterium]
MFLQRLHMQKFRCFSDKVVEFDAPLTIISGLNGQGKTSIIEAVYYLSYFKSFRSHVLHDLIQSTESSFFLKGDFWNEQDSITHTIQIGHAQHKKSVKFDQRPLHSFKQMLHVFQTVSLTEDDLDLIKGSPAARRAFMDHAVILQMPEKIDIYTDFRKILHQRNTFLSTINPNFFDRLQYEIWTQQLVDSSQKIQNLRIQVLQEVELRVNQLLCEYFDDIYQIALEYHPKHDYNNVILHLDHFLPQEMYQKRSLFGAHLDDLVFQIEDKKARIFASRGQQKLIILLAKWALATLSTSKISPIFLMDDFISDFDTVRLQHLINLFSVSKNQVILTVPYLDTTMQSLFEHANVKFMPIKTTL